MSRFQQLPQADDDLVGKILCKIKSQGIFDQFRKDCLADVDTKPAYQNLQERVNGTVQSFLEQHPWSADSNKNQLRESLRRHVQQGFLEVGVDRIVDQVVNPKIYSVFLPKVESVVYDHLGIEKPKTQSKLYTQSIILAHPPPPIRAPSPPDVLTKDPGPVSPEVKPQNEASTEVKTTEEAPPPTDQSKEDEESPPFEPLPAIELNEDMSSSSHLSGISQLTTSVKLETSNIAPPTSDTTAHEASHSNKRVPGDPSANNFCNLSEKIKASGNLNHIGGEVKGETEESTLSEPTSSDKMKTSDDEDKVKEENTSLVDNAHYSISDESKVLIKASDNEESCDVSTFEAKVRPLEMAIGPKTPLGTPSPTNDESLSQFRDPEDSRSSTASHKTTRKTLDSFKFEGKERSTPENDEVSFTTKKEDLTENEDSLLNHPNGSHDNSNDQSSKHKNGLQSSDRQKSDSSRRHHSKEHSKSGLSTSHERQKGDGSKESRSKNDQTHDKGKHESSRGRDEKSSSSREKERSKSSRKDEKHSSERHKDDRRRDKSSDKRASEKKDSSRKDSEKKDAERKGSEKKEEKREHHKKEPEGKTGRESLKREAERKEAEKRRDRKDTERKDEKRSERKESRKSEERGEKHSREKSRDSKGHTEKSTREDKVKAPSNEKASEEAKKKEKDSRKRKGERCSDDVKRKDARRSSDRDSSGQGSGRSRESQGSNGKSREHKSGNEEKGGGAADNANTNSDPEKPSDLDEIISKINSSIEEEIHQGSKESELHTAASQQQETNEGETTTHVDEAPRSPDNERHATPAQSEEDKQEVKDSLTPHNSITTEESSDFLGFQEPSQSPTSTLNDFIGFHEIDITNSMGEYNRFKDLVSRVLWDSFNLSEGTPMFKGISHKEFLDNNLNNLTSADLKLSVSEEGKKSSEFQIISRKNGNMSSEVGGKKRSYKKSLEMDTSGETDNYHDESDALNESSSSGMVTDSYSPSLTDAMLNNLLKESLGNTVVADENEEISSPSPLGKRRYSVYVKATPHKQPVDPKATGDCPTSQKGSAPRSTRSSQRYDSTDLYKPRPSLSQPSKRKRSSRSD